MWWFLHAITLACLSPSVSAGRKQRSPQTLVTRETNASTVDSSPLELRIDVGNVDARNETAPYLYGLMFEDINFSGDGGIYAELIMNRAFKGVKISKPFAPSLSGWSSIGSAKLSLDSLHALSEALPYAIKVDIPNNATGTVGFKNSGWWGFDIRPQTYSASFYVLGPKLNKTVDFTLSLESKLTGETWASSKIPAVDIPNIDYAQLNATIVNTKTAPNSNNTFSITMDASQVAGQTLYFNLISLFPETFKGRKNGLRKDLAEAFYDLKPKFLRFPGGNNLEGGSIDTRWKWWKTIGPLRDRPGRPGDWGYQNTDGLGLLEYLEWCEDMSITPILAVYAGYSLDGTSYSASEMSSAVQEALDELEYCMGATSTKYGALRASHGHPEPFDIKFIEIGNEDWFSTTYPYRWDIMYKALKAAYPKITYISTVYDEAKDENGMATKMELPPGTIWDTHHYQEPKWFINNFNYYDNWQARTNNTGVGVFLGEYSVLQVDTPSGIVDFGKPNPNRVLFPRLVSAISEGVYALGGERNPSVVKMSSYAPSLQNMNEFQWDPDMIHFTANHDETVLSASYWQQYMFGRYRGSHTLPVTNENGSFNPLFWAASIEDSTKTVYFKIINAAAASKPITISLAEYVQVNGTILTNTDVNAFNTLQDKTAVQPQPLEKTWNAKEYQSEGRLEWEVKGYSINILEFKLK
ncbi:glycoside hydrolase family protein [Venturia nashicola]|uniref:non-reducing end alpha-L-arabinofuranosidase n=1 Tax=Venturia nashicola TaxID=86259 RepID=A0A4Z1P9A5_9PEZI|nr:glycoside hydrolase family 51 protein [Venturia nashicola]TLD27608.1 glycoside hydrolase family protein [Venturia nashicola]